jgi:hypothetical protein
MNGCVAALDGRLGCIHAPSATEVEKVKSIFSGHSQWYGLNVQATFDARYRFTSLSVLCPGRKVSYCSYKLTLAVVASPEDIMHSSTIIYDPTDLLSNQSFEY